MMEFINKSLMYDLTPENKFELIFDEFKDSEELENLIQKQKVGFVSNCRDFDSFENFKGGI